MIVCFFNEVIIGVCDCVWLNLLVCWNSYNVGGFEVFFWCMYNMFLKIEYNVWMCVVEVFDYEIKLLGKCNGVLGVIGFEVLCCLFCLCGCRDGWFDSIY